jgi:Protein of unknown function (DUF3515)
VVAAVVLAHVVGSGGSGGSRVAEVSGPPSSAREELPVVPVDVPPVTPEAQASCPTLMAKLPLDLAGQGSRRVQSASPFAYAWGDPPIVLVCGIDRPAGLTSTTGLIQINGVQWLVDTSRSDAIVWTAVDRPVYVQVQVPASTDSASVTEITSHLAATLPAQAPRPGS